MNKQEKEQLFKALEIIMKNQNELARAICHEGTDYKINGIDFSQNSEEKKLG